MQKRATILTIVIVSVVFVGVMIGTYLLASSSSNKKLADINSKLESTQAEVDTLKAAQDTNGFTATDVVKAFWTEVKADSAEKAKLYLAPEAQAMDTKATLKLGSDLANITTGDNFEQADGDNMLVTMTFVMPSDESAVRIFSLSKYNEAWKITGVTAE
jgi:outer membrane murein-binding lipoprotein Lpp